NPTDSTQYKLGEHWVDYEFVSKSIAVKDSTEVHFTFKKTANGAVLNGIADQIDGTRPVSMWWTYTQLDNKVLNALYNLTHAQYKLEFQNSLHEIHAPGLNMMYGDADGNVAWWASAQLYQIPDSINTKLIFEKNHRLPTDRDYLDFSQNPKAINPPWHYVYSANNQPDSIAGMLYPGYYLPENRAKRIVQLLEPKNDWDKQSVMKMMIDDTSPVNKEIVTDLVKVLNVKNLEDNQLEILDKLNMWEGDYSLESTEATLFHRWIYHLLKNTFHDELGDDLFEQMLSTHFHKRLIAPLVRNPKSVWWDDMDTESVIETQALIVQAAFQDALSSLEKDLGPEVSEWRWGRIHTLEHGHPIGQVEALRSFFNVGPFPVRGSREVINNMYFGYGEANSYKVGHGPSTRRVIDFSDIENSMSILPTGQSGNPFSKYYRDQAELFVEGKFRKMMLNKEEIISTSESLLTFKPVQE
ncbi:MAG: penicillin acylase family protein, partial [Pricia sp.]|nr:penicillin acylase family protein [Pricia sp.]